MKQTLCFLGIIALCAGIWQCNNGTQAPSGAGANGKTMSVSFAIITNRDFNAIARYAFVTVKAPDMDSIKQQMVISDSMLSASLANIPLGNDRVFSITVYDSMGIVRYSGSQTVSLDGSPTRVVIILRKVSGPVEIIGIIQDSSLVDPYIPDTTWTDTSHIDSTHVDTSYIDSSGIVGGSCYYDTVTGYAVFNSVTAFSEDSVYSAAFVFNSPTVIRDSLSLYVSKAVARKIKQNTRIPAVGYFITKGTCTPEIYAINGITPIR